MFVKYVRSCLENLDKEHWLMLLETGKIETKAGVIKLASTVDTLKRFLIFTMLKRTHVTLYQ